MRSFTSSSGPATNGGRIKPPVGLNWPLTSLDGTPHDARTQAGLDNACTVGDKSPSGFQLLVTALSRPDGPFPLPQRRSQAAKGKSFGGLLQHGFSAASLCGRNNFGDNGIFPGLDIRGWGMNCQSTFLWTEHSPKICFFFFFLLAANRVWKVHPLSRFNFVFRKDGLPGVFMCGLLGW